MIIVQMEEIKNMTVSYDPENYEVNDLRDSTDGDVDWTHPPPRLVIVEIHQVPAKVTFLSIFI